MSDYVSTEGLLARLDDEGILRVTIDRPAQRGSMVDAMGLAFVDHLVAAGQDERVRVIRLGSSGDDFCAGSDLTAKNAPTGARPRVGSIQRRLPSTMHRLIQLLLETQVPVVTSVRGWAAGLGFHMAMASDFCIASTTARFWEPFIARGFTPDSAATWLLPRLVSLKRARELLLLGLELSGAEAAACDLIHAAVADAEVEREADSLALRLANAPTTAVGLTKLLLAKSLETPLEAQLRNEAFALELSSRSEDFREGLAAFREKRKPEFKGR